MVAKNDLVKGKKYVLVVGNKGECQEVVYRGRINDGLAKLWPHEFIGRCFIFDNSVLSYRMKENSYLVKNIESMDVVMPIPDRDGRAFYSNHYIPQFDGAVGNVSREKRLELIKELQETGL